MSRFSKLKKILKQPNLYRNLYTTVAKSAVRAVRARQATIKKLLVAFIFFFSVSSISLIAPAAQQKLVYYKTGSQIVYIESPQGAKHHGSATGFAIIAPSGKVFTITNQHVCELQKDGYVMIGESRFTPRLIPKKIIEIDGDADLCLLEGIEGYQGLSLADSVDTGDLNYTMGYPFGGPLTFSVGFVNQRTTIQIAVGEMDPEHCEGAHIRRFEIDTFIGRLAYCVIDRPAVATNIPTFPGNSGSPMVNFFGNVTGIIFAANNNTHWGYAVPLSAIKLFLAPY